MALSPTGVGDPGWQTSYGMGKVAIVLIAVLVVAVAGGLVALSYWDIPAPTSRVDKVLPDARFPK